MPGKIIISKEYKDHTSGAYRYKRVRCGSQFYGEIREYKAKLNDKALRIYWSVRLKGEHVQKHLAWAFDKLMFDKFSMEGAMITHVGVMVTADAKRRPYMREKILELWITKYDTFKRQIMRNEDGQLIKLEHSSKEKAPGKDRFDLNQILVPMAAFERYMRPMTEDEKIKEMKIGRYKTPPLPVSHS